MMSVEIAGFHEAHTPPERLKSQEAAKLISPCFCSVDAQDLQYYYTPGLHYLIDTAKARLK